MSKIYIETSFVSYLVARPSRDLIIVARQQITIDWWDKESAKHELYASEVVMREAQRGDPAEIAKRTTVLNSLISLETPELAIDLAEMLIAKHALPEKAKLDALHIAVATIHGMDYLLTWNCKHIANATMRGLIERTCREAGYEPPAIATPTEFGV